MNVAVEYYELLLSGKKCSQTDVGNQNKSKAQNDLSLRATSKWKQIFSFPLVDIVCVASAYISRTR